jgi:hypothetical protein
VIVERVTLICATGKDTSTVAKLSLKVAQNGLKRSKALNKKFWLSCG